MKASAINPIETNIKAIRYPNIGYVPSDNKYSNDIWANREQ